MAPGRHIAVRRRAAGNDVGMRILLALTLPLLLAACGADDPATTAPTDVASAPAIGEAPESEAAPTEPAHTETAETEDVASDPAEQATVAVILEPEALGFADEEGRITRLEFGGADKDTTVNALTIALGEPTGSEEGLECGPGVLDAVNWDGLSTYYLDGTFAGWYLEEPAPTQLTTADGIGLGTPLGNLRASYPDVEVDETTIGFEWTAGGLFGTLNEDSDTALVASIWSGANCIAR